MKLIAYTIVLLLGALFILCPTILASQVSGLSEIYDTPIPAEIRRNFNEYLQNLEYGHGFINGEKFIDIYTKKFLVIGLEPNSFGGVWAIIAVEGQTQRAFLLWLYDIDNGVYDLRVVDAIPGHFNKQFAVKLYSPAYSRFWL